MKNILSILLASLTVGAWAQAQMAETSRGTFYETEGVRQTSWAGYVAANSGYMNAEGNHNLEGVPTSLKLLGSYVTPGMHGVFDLGYGLQSASFSQGDALNSSISTGVMELAARYQFENRWQLGAVYNQYFNKGENFNANQADFELAGAQILREFSLGQNYLGRVGGRYMVSMNNNNETLNAAMIDFQVGWGAH